MRSILSILESFYDGGTVIEATKKFSKTVAVLPGAMKPPHAGHFDMIQKYAKKADEVIVLISDPKTAKQQRKTKNGTVITAEMSKEILDIYISRYGLQKKVKVFISQQPSPVTAAYDYVENDLTDCNVIFCSSLKGDDWKRFNGAQEYFKDRKDLNILDPHLNAVQPFANNGVAISATDIRNNIDDKAFIRKRLPERLTPKDLSRIMRILSDKPTYHESMIRYNRESRNITNEKENPKGPTVKLIKQLKKDWMAGNRKFIEKINKISKKIMFSYNSDTPDQAGENIVYDWCQENKWWPGDYYKFDEADNAANNMEVYKKAMKSSERKEAIKQIKLLKKDWMAMNKKFIEKINKITVKGNWSYQSDRPQDAGWGIVYDWCHANAWYPGELYQYSK